MDERWGVLIGGGGGRGEGINNFVGFGAICFKRHHIAQDRG